MSTDKVFRVKPALTEISSMSFTLPANMEECDAYIKGHSIGLTGREIVISSSQPEYLTEPYEYLFMATEFGIIVEDVTSNAEYLMTVKESKIHNDLMPNIANKLTIEDVDRFLFDHPLEPAVEAMLIKHGYVIKVTMKDIGTVLEDSAAEKTDSPGQISLFSGAENQNANATKTAGFGDSEAPKFLNGQIVESQNNPFKKQSIEA